jgi:transcriptional regulator with XRE-family HTH domain
MTENDFLFQLGTRIRRIRAKKNMSQFQLASLCDFEKASMSRIESGKTNTTILTLRKISKALGVEIHELFTD